MFYNGQSYAKAETGDAREQTLAAALAAQDALLDRALEETFPASDPISPMCPLSFR